MQPRIRVARPQRLFLRGALAGGSVSADGRILQATCEVKPNTATLQAPLTD
jgi:roadblock/LC7 domain-containing protein